jgi:hypothetical protein
MQMPLYSKQKQKKTTTTKKLKNNLNTGKFRAKD